MRRAGALAAAAVLALLLAAPPARAGMGPAPFVRHTELERPYVVYEPTAGGAGQPLVVFLHGCTQTADDAAVGTRWTELAERRRFTVVFPEQTTAANGAQCWNWFEPQHQTRDAGEPAIVAEITRRVQAAVGADPRRTYVIGISAGADLAMILGATHPDLYAATSGFAGCAYATCADVTGALAKAAMGEHVRVLPALLVQGTADPLNDFALGETMVRQWVGTDGLDPRPTSVEHHGLDGSAADGAGAAGDACVRNRQFPCASGLRANGEYPYSVEHHADAAGCDVVDFWIVHGLSHDYPGGDPAGTFTDPAGPDVTTAAYDWFLRHRLGVPCGGVAAASAAAAPSGSSASAVAELPLTGGTTALTLAGFVGLVMLFGCRWALRDAFWRPERITKAAQAARG